MKGFVLKQRAAWRKCCYGQRYMSHYQANEWPQWERQWRWPMGVNFVGIKEALWLEDGA